MNRIMCLKITIQIYILEQIFHIENKDLIISLLIFIDSHFCIFKLKVQNLYKKKNDNIHKSEAENITEYQMISKLTFFRIIIPKSMKIRQLFH